MTHSRELPDTPQLDPRTGQADSGAAAAASSDATTASLRQVDFALTEPLLRDDIDPRWWSEAADGQCSKEAAQFAASQPAPLSIV